MKAVPVEGVTPDPANASTYPLSRTLNDYTIAGKTSPEAMKFIQWSRSSPEASAIITEVGFIPAK